MGNAKVTLNGITLIDLTSDTVEAGALLEGYMAHGRDGEIINGTITSITKEEIDDIIDSRR